MSPFEYEYDEDASAAWRMDVAREVVDSGPVPVTRWVEAMRRLNGIRDPLARELLAVHRQCGSGAGECDGLQGERMARPNSRGWGCETTEIIARHFGIEYPKTPDR
jgi:hypothetical protein